MRFSDANMFIRSVIAITGLGGHAFGSWRSRAATMRPIDRAMWLRDFLPESFPNARIMTYGYDSSLREPSSANIADYRRGFIECLVKCRRKCPVSPCLVMPRSGLLTMSLRCIETPDCLHRAQFRGDPGYSGIRTSPKSNNRVAGG